MAAGTLEPVEAVFTAELSVLHPESPVKPSNAMKEKSIAQLARMFMEEREINNGLARDLVEARTELEQLRAFRAEVQSSIDRSFRKGPQTSAPREQLATLVPLRIVRPEGG